MSMQKRKLSLLKSAESAEPEEASAAAEVDLAQLDEELAKLPKTPVAWVGKDGFSQVVFEYEEGTDRIELPDYVEEKLKIKKEAPVQKTRDKKTVAGLVESQKVAETLVENNLKKQ